MNHCTLLIGLFMALCGAGVVLMAIVPRRRMPLLRWAWSALWPRWHSLRQAVGS